MVLLKNHFIWDGSEVGLCLNKLMMIFVLATCFVTFVMKLKAQAQESLLQTFPTDWFAQKTILSWRFYINITGFVLGITGYWSETIFIISLKRILFL